MSDCIFCMISERKIPAQILVENDNIIAFRDVNPQASTHILIIPRKHVRSTQDLNLTNYMLFGEMALIANKVAELEGITDKGYRWVVNTGNHGGQTVDHLHMHLIGGRKLTWPPG